MARILQLRQNEIYLKLSLIKQLLSLFLVSQKYVKVYLFRFCLYFPTLTVNLLLSSRVRKLNNISMRKLFTRFCWNFVRFNRYEDGHVSCFISDVLLLVPYRLCRWVRTTHKSSWHSSQVTVSIPGVTPTFLSFPS